MSKLQVVILRKRRVLGQQADRKQPQVSQQREGTEKIDFDLIDKVFANFPKLRTA